MTEVVSSGAAGRRSPLVSVILIFLDEERFLGEAIDSVTGQTVHDWELLLIDDGSEDRSGDIARVAAAQDPGRIRYLTHEGGANRGKSASRNLGLHEARGDYVAFLDGDDIFRPEKLERQTAILEANPTAAMVYGPTLYWWQWPGAPFVGRTDSVCRIGVTPDRIHPPPSLLVQFLRDGGIVPCICGLTVRRSVALTVGGFDREIHYMYEDQIFLAKVCLKFPVFVESGCWDQYRQHENSTSSRAVASGLYHPKKPNPSGLVYLEWLDKYVREHAPEDRELARMVQRAFLPYRHPVLAHIRREAMHARRFLIRLARGALAWSRRFLQNVRTR